MEIAVGDIVKTTGDQYLLGSNSQCTYLCNDGDVGLVISVDNTPDNSTIEVMMSGESMFAYPDQLKKIVQCQSHC